MRMFEIPGIMGLGLVLGILVACGGGGPDSTGDAQGAATGVPSGSASGTAPAGSTAAATAPPTAAPKSTTPTTGGATPGGTPPPTNPTTPNDKGANGLPVPNLPDGLPGLPGLPGNVGDGNDCCFNGKYFHCPNATACFGGFDLDACIQKCGADANCIEDCANQLDGTGAPQGCDANAAPPPGFDCGA